MERVTHRARARVTIPGIKPRFVDLAAYGSGPADSRKKLAEKVSRAGGIISWAVVEPCQGAVLCS